ncbi:DsbA family oxidoreductase [Sphingomonas oligophenolica]|uniref:DsbA family oxidoreductase n=1 Tax=Sphingomonas oligophenolica TaxID=301154 RepID=A0A502CMA9_9SPHN|nr:DsbA family oxidoreductase [Sphingomonas oligophenolica]TPG13764.1 DsbA family oxidoreductase [Sphingomonas oligophenolica]
MTRLTIDFVSDVVCPWCVIGLRGLEIALDRIDDVEADIRLHPFELNPAMGPEGQDIGEHIAEKYGATPQQSAANRDAIRQRAAEVGFTMSAAPGGRIYNSFDAHRLLDWAGEQGKALALKHALFTTYFTERRDIGDHAVLVDAAQVAGLDADAAREILSSDAHGDRVREEEARWRREGVTAVPTIVIDDRYMISGGQPADAFERALRQIAAEVEARAPA